MSGRRTLVVLLPGARPAPVEEPATVLSFASAREEEAFRSGRPSGDEWVPVAALLGPAVQRAREELVRFSAEWPRRRLRGRNFHERFADPDGLGLWWLSAASMKDEERLPTLRLLTQFEIARSIIAERGPSACVVLGGARGQVEMLRSYCVSHSVSFRASHTRSERRRSLLAALAAHVRLAFRIAWRCACARRRLPAARTRRDVTFISVLPGSFAQASQGCYHDRHYRDLPERMRSAGLDAEFLVYEGRWSLGLRREARDIRRRAQGSLPVELLSEELRWRDVLHALTSARHAVRYWLLDTFSPTFRASFQLLGADARYLLGLDYRARFLGAEVASHLLVVRTAERYARARRPQVVVCFLELYPLARALYEGIKRGHPAAATVAYQHASISSGKLWYCYEPSELGGAGPARMPTPDWYLLMGELGRSVVTSSGYPRERTLVVGSPRYDELARVVREPGDAWKALRAALGGDGRIVLVAPSLDRADAEGLVAAAAAALGGREGWTLVVRSHPLQPMDDSVAALAVSSDAGARVTSSRASLHDLILAADLVLVSYSTVGEEAVALGRPVVCYAGPGPTMSALGDFPEVALVHDARGLGRSVDAALGAPEEFAAVRERIVRRCFFRLDGRATERAAAALLEIAGRECDS